MSAIKTETIANGDVGMLSERSVQILEEVWQDARDGKRINYDLYLRVAKEEGIKRFEAKELCIVWLMVNHPEYYK